MPAGVDQREVHGGGRGEVVVTIPEPQEPDRPPDRADGEDSGPPAPAAVRAEVWCEVERRRHQMLDAAWQAIRATPPYDGLTELEAGEVRASVERVYALFEGCLSTDRSWTLDEIQLFEEIGVARAHRPIPLADVLDAFRTGVSCCVEGLLAVVGEHEHAAAAGLVEHYAARAAELSERAQNAIRRGYASLSDGQALPRDRSAAAFVESVLEGRTDPARLVEQAARLGVAGRGGWGLVLVVPRSPQATAADVHAAGAGLCRELDGSLLATVRTAPVAHTAVLVPPPAGAEPLRARLAASAAEYDVLLAVATHRRLPDLGARYRRAQPVAHLAPQIVDHLATAVDLDELEVHALLAAPSDPASAGAFVRATLGPALAQPDGRRKRWLATLEAVCELGGDVTAAAQRLHVTARAVRDRLAGIRETCGLDLRRDDGLFRVGLALRLLRLHGAELPPPGDPWWCPDEG